MKLALKLGATGFVAAAAILWFTYQGIVAETRKINAFKQSCEAALQGKEAMYVVEKKRRHILLCFPKDALVPIKF